MAYVIGLVDREEKEEIERAGYFPTINSVGNFAFLSEVAVAPSGLKEAVVWVACSVGELLELGEGEGGEVDVIPTEN